MAVVATEIGLEGRGRRHVDRRREELQDQSGSTILGYSGPALGILRGIVTVVFATITIFFMVFFMLREGRRWVDAGLSLLPAPSRPRWERMLAGMTRTIRGYVTGNLVISLIAGIVASLGGRREYLKRYLTRARHSR